MAEPTADVGNLMMAGKHISVTHIAGSVTSSSATAPNTPSPPRPLRSAWNTTAAP